MEIFVPPSLSTADATLKIAEALQKLTDPKERQKIETDIVAHHALNDAEAKKASDARALIKQHQAVLDETKRIFEQNKKDTAALAQKQEAFRQECEAERLAISQEWSDAKTASETAKNLHTKAEGMINSVGKREDDLRRAKKEHEENLNKHEEAKKALKKQKDDVDEYKRQVLALDNETKAKVEGLRKFNF